MNTATRPDHRRWIRPGLIGLGLGIGLSGVLAYFLIGSRVSSPAPGRLAAAGTLPRSAAGDPDAATKDEQARRAAEGILDALVKKDGAALASSCGLPFLWGRIERHRIIENPAEIERCLSEELLQGVGSAYVRP
jgi:hypothetical protein